MALNYTFTKSKDIYTLKNNESVTMTYIVKKVDCDATTILKTATIPAGQTITLSFILDGSYQVDLSTVSNTDTISDILITYNLLTSFIEASEKILCGCTPCTDCEECNECEDYLKAILKGFALNQVTSFKYQEFLQFLSESNDCLYNATNLACLLKEKVYGNGDLKPLLLQTVSFYYLAFYAKDLEDATNQIEKDYITELYKFSKISKCIRKTGVIENISEASFSIFNSVFNSTFS